MSHLKQYGNNRENLFRVYDVETVLNMLPLLRSISRSLAENAREITEAWDSDLELKEQEDLARIAANRRQYFKKEVRALGCWICHASEGLIDVPIWHPHLSDVVLACVGKNTRDEEDLMVHHLDENWKTSKTFWEL